MRGARGGRQRGLTLVELLVALVISLMLMTGLIQIFIANKVTYRTQEGLARLQENGRYAMQRLGRSARSAGYFGCSGLDVGSPKVLALNPPAGFVDITSDTPVDGIENATSGNAFGARTGTDVLTLRGAGEDGVGLVSAVTAINAAVVVTDGNAVFGPNDFVLFTDCATADLFKVTGVSTSGTTTSLAHSTAGNTSGDLSKPYGADAVVLKPFVHSYYVKDSGRDNAAGADIFSFYRRDVAGTDQELVEGVSDMQVLYGVDRQGGDRAADTYMTASAVNAADAWGSVVSIRVSLQVDSVENALQEPVDGDLRLRQEFAGLFTLRNRTL